MPWDRDHEGFFLDILRHTVSETTVSVLLTDQQAEDSLRAALDEAGLDLAPLRMVHQKLGSPWVRDFGPLVTRGPDGKREIVDFSYRNPIDDQLPARLAGTHWVGWPIVGLPFAIDGGSLLSDGQGHCVTTDRILAELPQSEHEIVRSRLADRLGCQRLITVPALEWEPTGHVDMLMTITGPRNVIVGRFDPAFDPQNAERLDRAADVLRGEGFKVRRIAMPEIDDDVLRSYTNALAVNGVVLVPVYEGATPAAQSEALQVFARAYPGRRIVPVDASEIITRAGAIHCVAITVATDHPIDSPAKHH